MGAKGGSRGCFVVDRSTYSRWYDRSQLPLDRKKQNNTFLMKDVRRENVFSSLDAAVLNPSLSFVSLFDTHVTKGREKKGVEMVGAMQGIARWRKEGRKGRNRGSIRRKTRLVRQFLLEPKGKEKRRIPFGHSLSLFFIHRITHTKARVYPFTYVYPYCVL